ncbi:MAG: hydrogenase [Bacteroidetes bacterium]|nr:hydrogenase [Bacteroidota bacterium]
MIHDSIIRDRLVTGDKTASDVTRDIARPILNNPSTAWKVGFTLSLIFLGIFGVSLLYTLFTGIGVWNINKSVMWGWDITNFVFWVGIGHAGTLISAVLLLFRQKWRMSINRSAEAMTIFAVICAAMFPVFHMGRVWVGYWALPLPNGFGSLWVNFNSPLLWDVFAISTYFSVSLLFWYIGLIPDIATIRDKVKSKLGKTMYGFFSMGWTGSTRTWARYELISLILAGLIFPPYFVAGAIFSGFGMVATLLVVARKVMNYENYITIGHLDAMTKIIMVTGTIVGIAYLTEFFIAWYSGNIYEQYAFTNRMFGPYWWAYWSMMTCNLIAPQVFWFRWARTTPWFIFIMSIVVNVGMWFERFVIIVTSLHRDYLPSSWVMYSGSLTEIGLFLGTFGIFFTCFFLFAKFLPVINMAEVKSILRNRE